MGVTELIYFAYVVLSIQNLRLIPADLIRKIGKGAVNLAKWLNGIVLI